MRHAIGPQGNSISGAGVYPGSVSPLSEPAFPCPQSVHPEPADRRDGIVCMEFDSLAGVKPYWEELNRTYKGGELTLDWEAHRIIEEHYLAPRGYELRVHVFLEEGRCIGIVPLNRTDSDPMGTQCWSISDEFVIAREYFVRPERFHAVLPMLPPHYADDLSAFYTPVESAGLESLPAGLIDIGDSEEGYIAGLRKSARHDLRNTLRRNGDVESEFDGSIRWDAVRPLLECHFHRWMERCGGEDTDYYRYTEQKISGDMRLMQRASEMGRLFAQYMFIEGRLVAANFAVRREDNRLDDYMCLRLEDPAIQSRGLGVLAVLRNMAQCRAEGIRYYDMSSCSGDYKRRFANVSFAYLRPRYDDPSIQPCEQEREKAAAAGPQA